MRAIAEFMFSPRVGLGLSWAIHILYYFWGRDNGVDAGRRQSQEQHRRDQRHMARQLAHYRSGYFHSLDRLGETYAECNRLATDLDRLRRSKDATSA